MQATDLPKLFPNYPELPNGPLRLIIKPSSLREAAVLRLVSKAWRRWIEGEKNFGNDLTAVREHRGSTPFIEPSGPIRNLTIPVLDFSSATEIKLLCSRLDDQGLNLLATRIPGCLESITLEGCSGTNLTLAGFVGLAEKIPAACRTFMIKGCVWLTSSHIGELVAKLPSGVRPCFVDCPNQDRIDFSGKASLTDDQLITFLKAAAPSRPAALDLTDCTGLSDQCLDRLRQKATRQVMEIRLANCKFSEGGLKRLLQNLAQGIGVIDLRGCTGFTTAVAADPERRAGAWNRLRTLDVRQCANLSPDSIVSLIQPMKHLETLALGNNSLTDGQLESILAVLPSSVKRLTIDGPNLTNAAFNVLQTNLPPKLEQLNLTGCTGMTELRIHQADCRSAQLLLNAIPESVQSLVIEKDAPLTKRDINQLFTSAPRQLRAISVNHPAFTGRALTLLNRSHANLLEKLVISASHCNKLTLKNGFKCLSAEAREVELYDVSLPHSELKDILPDLPCTHLESFGLIGSSTIDNGVLLLLGARMGADLRELRLTDMPLVTNADAIIRYLPHPLTHLELGGMTGISSEGMHQLVNELHASLVSLDLSQTQVGDDAVASLNPDRYPNLKLLDLNHCSNLTNRSATQLAHWIQLDRPESDATEYRMANCPNIRVLDLTDLADFKDAHLGKVLDRLSTCRIQTINLKNCTGLTAAIVPMLNEFERLEKLDLTGCALDSDQVRQLNEDITIIRLIYPSGQMPVDLSPIADTLTDESLKNFLAGCKGIHIPSFKLDGCRRLTGASLRLLSRSLTGEVAILSLAGCSNFTPKEFESLTGRLYGIIDLDLTGCKIGSSSGWIPRNVQTLRMSGCRLELSTKVECDLWAQSLPKSLSHLELANNAVSSELLSALADVNLPLTHLDVRNNPQLGDEGLIAVLRSFADTIRTIDLTGCHSLTERGIRAFGSYMPKGLKKLGLGIEGLSDKVLASVVTALPQSLESLDLTGCRRLSDRTLKAIAKKQFPALSLSLRGSERITGAGVEAFLARVEGSITLLDLRDTTIERFSFGNLQEKAIENIANIRFPQTLRVIDRHLADLSLYGMGKGTDASIQALASNCPDLRKVNLRGSTTLTRAAVESLIENCTQLTDLNLSSCGAFADQAISLLVERRPNKLRALTLHSNASLTDGTVIALAQSLRQLAHINLVSCTELTDDAIVAVARGCNALRYLRLDGCGKVTDRAVLAVAENCPDLETLYGPPSLSDQAIIALAEKCRGLKRLSLIDCTNLTGEALMAVARHSRGLTLLNLARCAKMPPEAIFEVAQRCNGLNRVNFAGCELLTEAHRQEFRVRFPHIKGV